MPGLIINRLVVFVAMDDKGDEGIMGAKVGEIFYPLICADDERLEVMYLTAEQIKKECDMDYRVIEFTSNQDVTEEVIEKFSNKTAIEY